MRINNRDMLKVSHYFYELGFNQVEIAEKFNMSRQRVGRLLKRAVDEGIVEIRVHGYQSSNAFLESELEQKFKLREALVVDDGDTQSFASTVMGYLRAVVQDGFRIGVSHGTTIAKLCDVANFSDKHDIKIVQLTGGMNTIDLSSRPDEITLKFARIFGGEAHVLFAPAITQNPELRRMLMEEGQFKEILELYKQLDISVSSIGALVEDNMLLKEGSLSAEDFETLSAKGCVGDVVLRFIDAEGAIIDEQLDERVMSIPISDYLATPRKIGVAYGLEKLASIRGAIAGGFVNILITDATTAKALLPA